MQGDENSPKSPRRVYKPFSLKYMLSVTWLPGKQSLGTAEGQCFSAEVVSPEQQE